jgi:molybdate transport system regulatory protein
MKISARNQYKGTISSIHEGPVNSEIELTISGGAKIVATITSSSSKRLGLATGKEVIALIKASSVLLMTNGSGIQLSARNTLDGKVIALTPGKVNTEVQLSLAGGGVLHAVVTNAAAQELGLASGVAASAVFKASSVILGVPA